MTPPIVLSIAGSDSGGGAGVQADLRTFGAMGVHGCTAVTALTAQNTSQVRGVAPTDPEFLRAQIEAVLDDMAVAAVKTGMLATAANVAVVADFAAQGRLPNLVVDPVMVSSSGARLLDDDAVEVYLNDLIPHASVITPNCRESGVLLGADAPIGLHAQIAAARLLLGAKAAMVVVTGGDMGDAQTRDVVASAGESEVDILSSPRIDTINNHGTGCSFAAAIAAHLALGHDPLGAVHRANSFVHEALVRAVDWRLGAGHGPIDQLDFANPRFKQTARINT